MSLHPLIRRVADLVSQARRGVVFTGAGISTDSGIPDFRSPDGVWSKVEPVYFDEFLASKAARFEHWRQKCLMYEEFGQALPNAGHCTLAAWEAAGHVRGVITQNIDELHQQAGSSRVLELHGTARKIVCLECETFFPLDPLVAQFRATGEVPLCQLCGGLLKHATISFGQQLPADVLLESSQWCREADLFLAIGSSLVVTPAADLPRYAKRNGAWLVIINRDPTPLDEIADVVVNASISETLEAIERVLRAG